MKFKKIKKEESSISYEKMKQFNKNCEMADHKFFQQILDFLPRMGAANTAILTVAMAFSFFLHAILGIFVLFLLSFTGFYIETDIYNHPLESILKLWFSGIVARGLATLLYKKLSPEWDL